MKPLSPFSFFFPLIAFYSTTWYQSLSSIHVKIFAAVCFVVSCLCYVDGSLLFLVILCWLPCVDSRCCCCLGRILPFTVVLWLLSLWFLESRLFLVLSLLFVGRCCCLLLWRSLFGPLFFIFLSPDRNTPISQSSILFLDRVTFVISWRC